MALPFDDAYALIEYIVEQQQEEFVMQRWINGYQHVNINEFRKEISSFKPNALQSEQSVQEVIFDLKTFFG